MPRPKKCRKVCCLPPVSEFRAQGGIDRWVVLSVDEYEAIRLIDKEGFSQQECAGYMRIARTTVQSIYNTARSKIGHALAEGWDIRIEGGDYALCAGTEEKCACGGCRRHRGARSGTDKNPLCEAENPAEK